MPKLLPDGPGAARVIGLANAATDVLGGVLCAVVARWIIGFSIGLVGAVAIVAWLVGGRRWALAFVATTAVFALF